MRRDLPTDHAITPQPTCLTGPPAALVHQTTACQTEWQGGRQGCGLEPLHLPTRTQAETPRSWGPRQQVRRPALELLLAQTELLAAVAAEDTAGRQRAAVPLLLRAGPNAVTLARQERADRVRGRGRGKAATLQVQKPQEADPMPAAAAATAAAAPAAPAAVGSVGEPHQGKQTPARMAAR